MQRKLPGNNSDLAAEEVDAPAPAHSDGKNTDLGAEEADVPAPAHPVKGRQRYATRQVTL